MSSSSSSPQKISISKPLNPSALSYQPLNQSFPFHGPLPSFTFCYPWRWDIKEVCLDQYNPKLQPRPWTKVCKNSPTFIPHLDGTKKKKLGRLGLNVPPRLRSQPRVHPIKTRPEWVKKEDSMKIKATYFHVNGDGVNVTAEELKKLDGNTSLMIKNIPNHFQRIDLQLLLDNHCGTENEEAHRLGSNFCKSAYDFIYLPMDFVFHSNLGFAFVNFTTPIAALRFYKAFNNREWSCVSSRKKICEIGIARFQGKQLKENFQYSAFSCHTNECLPVVFWPPRDGTNHSSPRLVGRRTYNRTATPKDHERVMVMTKRKIKSQKL